MMSQDKISISTTFLLNACRPEISVPRPGRQSGSEKGRQDESGHYTCLLRWSQEVRHEQSCKAELWFTPSVVDIEERSGVRTLSTSLSTAGTCLHTRFQGLRLNERHFCAPLDEAVTSISQPVGLNNLSKNVVTIVRTRKGQHVGSEHDLSTSMA